jgi:hypothetical protein
MNKKIMLLFLIILFSGCTKNEMDHISKRLDLNMDSCRIIESEDTHGGFLGDGHYFAKVSCDKVDTSNWGELPLSEELQEVLNLKYCDNKGCYNIYEKYNISDIKNGYYYFYDRYSDSTNPTDDSDINNRSSYNFTVAIYDKDNKIIYFYELDT